VQIDLDTTDMEPSFSIRLWKCSG